MRINCWGCLLAKRCLESFRSGRRKLASRTRISSVFDFPMSSGLNAPDVSFCDRLSAAHRRSSSFQGGKNNNRQVHRRKNPRLLKRRTPHDPSQCYTTRHRAGRCNSSVSCECSGRGNSPNCAGASTRQSGLNEKTVTDASQGVQLATIQALARYWATDYDWRKIETRMNALPQFMTEIDGLDIHFIHVRSKHENAFAADRYARMARLGHRTDEDHRSADQSHRTRWKCIRCFPPGDPVNTGLRILRKTDHHRVGWSPHRARAWVVLMKRLGYTKFVAQGGDWGAVITETNGSACASGVARHSHQHAWRVFRTTLTTRLFSGAPAPWGLSADEKLAYERLQFVYQKGIGYGYQMGLRPQTLYGIVDSPVGLAAYFLDHDAAQL